jgi:hypothetical protein
MRARKTEKRSSLNNVTTSLLTLKKTYWLCLVVIIFLKSLTWIKCFIICETVFLYVMFILGNSPLRWVSLSHFTDVNMETQNDEAVGLDCSRTSHLPKPCNVSRIYLFILSPFADIVLSHCLICK